MLYTRPLQTLWHSQWHIQFILRIYICDHLWKHFKSLPKMFCLFDICEWLNIYILFELILCLWTWIGWCLCLILKCFFTLFATSSFFSTHTHHLVCLVMVNNLFMRLKQSTGMVIIVPGISRLENNSKI